MHGFLERAVTSGSLQVVATNGDTASFGDSEGPPVRVRFTSEVAERRVTMMPDPGIGEAFMSGGLVVETGTIYDFVLLLQKNANNTRLPSWYMASMAGRYLTRRIRQFNTPLRSRRNVKRHYDLTGDLYRLFLDDDLQYSCAYFETPESSLAEAQLAKKRHLAAKLDIQPGQRILDIGSGWGGLGLYLAEQFDVDVVGITLSEEQLRIAQQRTQERGLTQRVDFQLQDYRKIEGPFDRIVSVGMFEHVGISHYRTYFGACRKLLSDSGLMVLHSIGRFDGPGETSAFLSKYIFPGGYIPALSEVLPAIEKTGMFITDVEILRLHYADTLRHWRQRFMANRDAVKELYDERFCRMWEFYLAASEMGFRVGGMMNFQVQLSKDVTTPPITRDYITATENELRNRDGPQGRRFELAGE